MEPPKGVEAITQACSQLYPSQDNPIQIASRLKYWLGGPDPLDYISVYRNSGHWHYVSFGLSDLHGDGRVHSVGGSESGFGFELTFRLCDHMTGAPPTWPAELLQSIARYVFSSGSHLMSGDHISWHKPLDGGKGIIRHLLLTLDPQMPSIATPHGSLAFIQLVGVAREELTAAQWWNVGGVLNLMASHQESGGPLLLTDVSRTLTLFQLDDSAQGTVDAGISNEGSLLSGVQAHCSWSSQTTPPNVEGPHPLSNVTINLNKEAIELLLLAIRGRLRHGRHFSYQPYSGEQAVTLVCEGVEGVVTSSVQSVASVGQWLQIFLGEEQLQSLEVLAAEYRKKPVECIKLKNPDITIATITPHYVV